MHITNQQINAATMKSTYFKYLRLNTTLVLSIFLFISCTQVRLSSNYDEVIDQNATKLHKKIDLFFINLQTADERAFVKHQDFYNEVVVDLNSLKIRAGGIYKNERTIELLELIEQNIAYTILLHKGCVTGTLTDDQKEKIQDNGIDTSPDCKVKYGASSDRQDRGNSELNPALVAPIKSLLDQNFGAIVALELAKKRGE